MTSPSTIPPKFLSNGHELGVVAVGFSGGQVCLVSLIVIEQVSKFILLTLASKNQASTLALVPLYLLACSHS